MSHIQNFGDLLKEMPHLPRETRNLFQETRSFSTGDVSSPLEMHIPRIHTHISRSKWRISRARRGGISKILDMWHCWSHLRLFLNNIHQFLKRQLLDYTIFIVNQNGQGQFNRAALFNVGYIEAMKSYPFNCFIFHDVDLLPEDLRNLYKCGEKPRHM